MASDFPKVTPFSVAFGAALQVVMDKHGVSQSAVARAIGKKAGASFVSERVNGKRAVDTDIIAGVAELANVQPSAIVAEVMRQMKSVATKSRTPKATGAESDDATGGEQTA